MTHSQVIILNPKLSKGLCASSLARPSLMAYVNFIESQDVRLWMAQDSNVVGVRGSLLN